MASSSAATAKDALWGSTPIKTFMGAHTSVSVGPSPSACAKDIPTTSGPLLPYLFRVTPHASGTGGTQA